MTVAELRSRFTASPVQCVDGEGGLPCLKIKTDLAEATIYLQGAHVTHFQPRGQKPVLFMSGSSWFAADKPLRGGVPICFPWFGPRPTASPGRPTASPGCSSGKSLDRIDGNGAVDVILRLNPTDFTRSLWPADFSLEYRVRVARATAHDPHRHQSGL